MAHVTELAAQSKQVYFIGVDLAWGVRNPTGVAVVDGRGRLVHIGAVRDNARLPRALQHKAKPDRDRVQLRSELLRLMNGVEGLADAPVPLGDLSPWVRSAPAAGRSVRARRPGRRPSQARP